MSRLLSGVMIVLFVVLVGLLVSFISGQATTASQFDESCSGQNATDCAADAQSRSDFIDTLRDAEVLQIAGAPAFINVVYLTIMVTLLTAGILLVIFSFVPLTAE